MFFSIIIYIMVVILKYVIGVVIVGIILWSFFLELISGGMKLYSILRI